MEGRILIAKETLERIFGDSIFFYKIVLLESDH